MRSLARWLDSPVLYGVWQAPFAEGKLRPIKHRFDLESARRVLDIGCGPGTNAAHFKTAEYMGLDINPAYIEFANKKYGRKFEVADVRYLDVPKGSGFDFVLINSLLHHLEIADVRTLLARVSDLLTDDGRVHILDLVMPRRPSIARLLAQWDRGDHPRKLEEWHALLSESLELEVFEPYSLPLFGPTLWQMVYVSGRRMGDA